MLWIYGCIIYVMDDLYLSKICIFWKLILIVPNAKKYLHNIFMYSSQTVK